ncbi:hypothetical protein [Hymenobacter sublimis]|uniref:Uncharacterized protein n=1 Tax=Hymenobacter sublimis TaxID=2933777 RepID=A0ABY4JF75_9BACT|nr:hypothetical protein [Hymenobacter sublimis]UPL51270.1 hypothetical protein MWH26_19675 [Hymenobacter sublimis]
MPLSLIIEKVDLYSDWVKIAKQRLTAYGFNISQLVRDEEVSLEYFNVLLHLTIPVHSRQVFYADTFNCPPELHAGLLAFIEKIESGRNLRPHMSRGVKKVANRDALRYDWGIHHFHLGTTLAPDGFIIRTEPVLFAWVANNAVYMLGLYPHGAWSQQEVLQVLYRNWPALLSPYTIKGASLTHVLTDQEVAQARKAGVTVAFQVAEGVAVVPPGGGMPTSKHSFRAVRDNDKLLDNLDSMTEQLRDPNSAFMQEYERKGAFKKRTLSFSLVEHNTGCMLIEKHNTLHFKVDGIPSLPLP